MKILFDAIESKLFPVVLVLIFALTLLYGGITTLLSSVSAYDTGVAIVCFTSAAAAVAVARYWATHDPDYGPPQDEP